MSTLSIFSKIIQILQSPPPKSFTPQVTYEELAHLVFSITHFLIKNTPQQSRLAAILSPEDPTSYALIFSCLLSQRIYCPLPHDSSPTLLAERLNGLECQHIYVSPQYSHLASTLPNNVIHIKSTDFTTKNPQFFFNHIHQPQDLNAFFYIMWTSGTQSRGGRATPITLNSFFHFLTNILNRIPIKSEDRLSLSYSFSFDPSLADVFLCFFNQASLQPMNLTDFINLNDFLNIHQITQLSLTPSHFQFFESRRSQHKMNPCHSLKRVIFTGEQLTPHTLSLMQELAPFSEIMNFYGPVETCIWVSSYKVSLNQNMNQIPIGRPFEKIEFKIVNENQQPAPMNELGELFISGPQLSSGYINDPNLTQERFTRTSWDQTNKTWYRTGDIGYQGTCGNFFLQGRIDNEIKLSGQRINLDELKSFFENELNQNSLICKDPLSPPPHSLCLVLQKSPSDKIDLLNAFQKLSDLISPSLIPKKIYLLNQFPLNTNGKVNLNQVSEMISANPVEFHF